MDKKRKEILHKKIKKISAILKLVVLLGIVVAFPLYIYFFQQDWITYLSNVDNIKELISSHKVTGIFIYIGAQILQIIISMIPGQWLQLAVGYIYGLWLGFLFSLIGAFLGTIATYYLGKFLGRDALHLFFGEESVNTFIHRLNSKKSIVIVFLIYLIPGIPKDFTGYVAGLSEMKLKPFVIVSLLGRSFGIFGSLLIGKQLANHNYTGAIIIGVLAIIFCILGVIFRKKVTGWFDKTYNRMIK